MIATIQLYEEEIKVDLDQPISLALPLKDQQRLCAWGAPPPSIRPYVSGDFVGSLASGSAVNFFDISFNPHAHGTHTETIQHILDQSFPVADVLDKHFFKALLITVSTELLDNGDQVIGLQAIQSAVASTSDLEAVIIRTNPNDRGKRTRNYSGTNPPYFSKEVAELLKEKGIKHWLVDLPSVDKESDGGALVCHKTFWGVPENLRTKCTITELIYVPDTVPDGAYLLQLSVPAIINDAALEQSDYL